MKVGSIGFSTEQGIGYLLKDFREAGVITDACILRHGRRPDHLEWHPGCLVISDVRRQLDEMREWCRGLDCLLCIETPFRYELYQWCREIGVRTVLVPMYEGFPQHPPHEPDCYACPSLLDQDIFRERCTFCRGVGFVGAEKDPVPTSLRKLWAGAGHESQPFQEPCKRHPFVPVPVKQRWQKRERAVRWLHNGGHLGLRGHKGTLELMRAMEFVKSDVSLTIRAQDVEGLARLVEQVPSIVHDRRVSIFQGDVSRECLFDGYDALIQPEKYNGLSLPLQEARAAGMLVVTSDRYPHNIWLPREPLIPVKSYSRQRVAGSCLEYDEAEIDPRDIAVTIDRLHGTDIGQYSEDGRQWAESMSWAALKPLWMEVLKG